MAPIIICVIPLDTSFEESLRINLMGIDDAD